jgi:hypothetical protein
MSENTVENAVPVLPELTGQEILAAATNAPSLAPDEFVLGDRTYKVVDLSYDDYVSFLTYLQPFLDGLVGNFASKTNVSLPGISLSQSIDAPAFVKFCGKSLPEMTRLICKQTNPDITVDEVKLAAGNPFVLAAVVIKQVNKNQMISTFASFFGQLAPLLSPRK